MWLAEPFTKGQAWIDLFANANHKVGSFWVRGNKVTVGRGQIGWSQLTMSDRWGWSEGKVNRFIKYLETEGQIKVQSSPLTTLITIVNYDKYQLDEGTDKGSNSEQTANRQGTNNNVNNDNNENKNTAPVAQPFDFIAYRDEMLTNPKRHIQLIGRYLKERKLTYKTKEQAQEAFKRHLRAAVAVAKFGDDQVIKAVRKCRELHAEKQVEWTLETVLKMLTK